MATPQEILDKFQQIADLNRQDQLSQEMRDRFDLAVSKGFVVLPGQQSIEVSGASPRARRASIAQQQAELERDQFLSSIPVGQRELLEGMNPIQAFLVGAGGGMTKIARGVGLADPLQEDEKQAIEALEGAFPFSSQSGEVVGEAAPFLPLGVGASGISSTPLRALATAILGGTEGATIARGSGGDAGDQIIAGSVGGAVAGALELGMPVLGRVGGRIVRRVTGKSPKGAVIDAAGNPSDEFLSALDKAGLGIDDVVDESLKELKFSVVDPEHAARKAFLESQGLVGEAGATRAQISRSVDDFALQQEALKSAGRVERQLAAQDRVLTTRFDDIISDIGDPFSGSSGVTNAVIEKASSLDNEVGRLYKLARERAGDSKIVRFDGLAKKLKELAPLNDRARGNVKAIFGTMQNRGLIDDNFKPTGRISIEDTETHVRQLINQLYDKSVSGGDIQNSVLREMKSALDDDVFRASGDDIFKQARSAKAKFEEGLTRAKVSKFDKRSRNLVRSMVENSDSVNPENFTNKVVFNKSWRSSDLEQLRDYITTEGYGEAGWNELRAEVLQEIKDRSFIGPEDAEGFQSLSRDKIEKAIAAIGDDKLKVLFSPEELDFLDNMKRIARYREPRKMTQQGFGPTAKAVLSLEKKASNMPLISSVYGFFDVDAAGRLATRSRPVKLIPQTEGSLVRQSAALGGGALAAGAVAGE